MTYLFLTVHHKKIHLDVAERADLILNPDELKMGDAIPIQAQKLGAKHWYTIHSRDICQ